MSGAQSGGFPAIGQYDVLPGPGDAGYVEPEPVYDDGLPTYVVIDESGDDPNAGSLFVDEVPPVYEQPGPVDTDPGFDAEIDQTVDDSDDGVDADVEPEIDDDLEFDTADGDYDGDDDV